MQIRSQLTRCLGESATTPKITETESKPEIITKQKVNIALNKYKQQEVTGMQFKETWKLM